MSAPIPNSSRLLDFHERAVRNVLDQHQAYLSAREKRGLIQAVLEEYCVGFMPEHRFLKWHTWKLENFWCFPIPATPDGPTCAIKLHFETHPSPGMKSMWAPFGTEPKEKPTHGFSTLWPCPEWFPVDELLILAPGELKALALICAGFNTTSPTSGEALRWTPELVSRLSGRKLAINFDDDPAGHKFRDKTVQALCHYVPDLRAFTFGKKGKVTT